MALMGLAVQDFVCDELVAGVIRYIQGILCPSTERNRSSPTAWLVAPAKSPHSPASPLDERSLASISTPGTPCQS